MSDTDFTTTEIRRGLATNAKRRADATEELHRWIARAYTQGELTVDEIAKLAGLTRPGVYHVLDHMGVDRTVRTPRSPAARRR